jgi:hypothetical protein
VIDLPTLEQAEDAAATAMAELLMDALERSRCSGPRPWNEEPGLEDYVNACRELLRGPVDEDYSRRPGGYCMRAPRDPGLYALGRYGARLVELSYTARDLARALEEART